MKSVNIILMGFGRVGQAFVRLVHEKSETCSARYGLNLRIVSVFTSKGAFVFPGNTMDWKELADLSSGFRPERSSFWKPSFCLTEALEADETGVLVECTPSDIKHGEPGLSHIYQALDAGWHVVTANKGPLVVDFRGLKEKAEKNRATLGLSGAAAAALPTLDVALYSLAGTEITCIEGILNGTTNYILTRMNQGLDYQIALEEAQKLGIAEPDPSLDVEGWDTAAKILIITNVLFSAGFTLEDIHVEGITDIPSDLRERARQEGKCIKLLGRFVQLDGTPKLETTLSLIDFSHPLYGVNGAQKGITFSTDTMDSVTVTGGKSDPMGAAAALLKDIINIHRG
ncbi:MAG: homoserine dehydrogenase [Candidatus Aminicenantes bacterium]|nr:homoserine dehydrogenase [Candidatus Aminicenantes bacterium]